MLNQTDAEDHQCMEAPTLTIFLIEEISSRFSFISLLSLLIVLSSFSYTFMMMMKSIISFSTATLLIDEETDLYSSAFNQSAR
jgi:hypothetical protein